MSSLLQLSDFGELLPHSDSEIYRERLADLLQRRTKSFPGAQPVSFSKKHFRALQEEDYYLCEKTDGTRCLLYLTFFIRDGAQQEAHFLIDRKNQYYFIDNEHFHFPMPDRDLTTFHTETLLDGELVLDVMPDGSSKKRYLVFDCLALDDKPLLARTLDKRLGYFTHEVLRPYMKLFEKFPEERAEQPFELLVKKMEKAYGIQMMFKDILPNLPHGNDGLVFTCRTSEYVIGTDPHIIKWKPPHENTIDFRLQVGEFPSFPDDDEMPVDGQGEKQPDWDACPSFDLLVNHGGGARGGGDRFFAHLHVSPDEWASMKSINQMLDARIIECYKDTQARWRFKREKDGSPRFRDDKSDANHISTVESVLESIEDAVGERDLLELARPINVAWKEREKVQTIAREAREAQERQRRARAAAVAEEERKRKEAAQGKGGNASEA